jgi:solute carrier family 35 protein E1
MLTPTIGRVVGALLIKACVACLQVHVLANTLTSVALSLMAVSFTHTIKALEPFFSVMLSMIFLGERPHPLVLLCLLPIVGGVIGATLSEISFTPLGFAAAMGSNVSLCFRNVLSKKFMTPEIKELLGGPIGLFSMITAMSFLILAPITVLVEGVQLTPQAIQAAGVNVTEMVRLIVQSSLFFHFYQQVSYMILSRVSPVSHSIGNTLKVGLCGS